MLRLPIKNERKSASGRNQFQRAEERERTGPVRNSGRARAELYLESACPALLYGLAVVDGHCSSLKSINSGVPQGSVLSPTLFLLFINDPLAVNNCPIHSYADGSTLHFSTSFDRRPTLQDLQDSRLEAAERLTSDRALISN